MKRKIVRTSCGRFLLKPVPSSAIVKRKRKKTLRLIKLQ